MAAIYSIFWTFILYLIIVTVISYFKKERLLQETGSYIIALAFMPVIYLILNAIFQEKNVTSNIDFGERYLNLPNYLVFIATGLNAFLLFKALTSQNEFNKRQAENYHFSQYEQHYFQLLKYFRDLSDKENDKIATISSKIKAIFPIGVDYMSRYFDELLNNDDDGRFERCKDYKTNKENKIKMMKMHLEILYKQYNIEKDFGHYFRSLYHLIKYVDEFPDENVKIDKNKYIDLIQAYMNDDELYLCYIGGLGYSDRKQNSYGNNFAIYAEKYCFLENILSKGDFFNYQFRNFYPKNYERWKSKGYRAEFGVEE